MGKKSQEAPLALGLQGEPGWGWGGRSLQEGAGGHRKPFSFPGSSPAIQEDRTTFASRDVF